MDPGFDSGFDPGMDPGYDPGLDPGTDPGYDPGLDPGMDPGFDSGFDPGMDPGYDPGTSSATTPARPKRLLRRPVLRHDARQGSGDPVGAAVAVYCSQAQCAAPSPEAAASVAPKAPALARQPLGSGSAQ